MKCYKCGCTLSENDFCTNCGADVHIYRKIVYLSNMYYNDGLRKAQVRDLSGAVASLRQSLKCNRNNIEARNLLGLVYFEMGEAVAALSEWVISKNIRPEKNIADDFMQQVQSNPTRLDNINKSIKKYNQALIYCNQGSLDLAVIQLKKVLSMNPNLIVAYQLLGLLYLNSEEWEKAKRTLEKAARIDADNTTVLYYLREANRVIREREITPEVPKPEKKHSMASAESISYQSGNDTIIQPLNGPERSASSTIINIIIGIVIGLCVTWFLILPARIKAAENKVNKQLLDVSNELTEKSADIDDLNKRITALQSENQDSKDALAGYTGTSGVLQKYDALCEAALNYMEKPDDILTTAKTLEGISGVTLSVNSVSGDSASGNSVSANAGGLDSIFDTVSGNVTYSDAFKNLFKYLSSDVSVKAAKQYLDSGLSAYNKKDYASAITNLETAYNMDPSGDEALFYLAMSYMKSDNAEKATELFSLIVNNFPKSQYLSKAKKYIETGATEDTSDTGTAGQSTQDTQNTAAAAQNALALQAAQAAAAQNAGTAGTAGTAGAAGTAGTADTAGAAAAGTAGTAGTGTTTGQ